MLSYSNYCTSYSADNFRIFQSGNACICQNEYYENSQSLAYNQCDISCPTCSSIATYCTSCDSLLNLSLNQQNVCLCQSINFLVQPQNNARVSNIITHFFSSFVGNIKEWHINVLNVARQKDILIQITQNVHVQMDTMKLIQNSDRQIKFTSQYVI
ncbi:unnamed protein product (macronuclear) [Paramecium tetraurelia]|uniref:Transmembrane protein n=1 Tax=Paramecium tetraurelia TaxID=5888 RepID=A0D2W6_PARTE|nr:uncharacterized protein GSPATT00039211001 [Paramecium tetraurelia]CAK77383.1 unnamed protein product [Paramecium tetraurelia]|eukprot:XP_001444780.1 hypothetical protein (macronuclear) [Paramecium tetraurelia strain d4-2]